MMVGEFLNSISDRVFVRNVKTATKRLHSFHQSAENVKLKYEVFEGINGELYFPPGEYPNNPYYIGNAISFMDLIFHAMKCEYDSIIYCDDDSIFYNCAVSTSQFAIPENCDLINLGSINKTREDGGNISPTLQLMSGGAAHIGSQCMLVKRKCYHTLIDYLLAFKTHYRVGDGLYDTLSSQGKLNMYKTSQDICWQERTALTPYVTE